MLRLLKKYKFGYHINELKNATRVPTRSITMSSYPGALSSQDEYYILNGEKTNDIVVLAGTSVKTSIASESHDSQNIHIDEKFIKENQLESEIAIASLKIMAANWLSSDTHTWTRLLAQRQSNTNVFRSLQWIIVRTVDMSIWLVEQHQTMTHVVEYTRTFYEKGILYCDENSLLLNAKKDELVADVDLTSIIEMKKIDRVPRTEKMKKKLEEWTKNIEINNMKRNNENHEDLTINNNSHVENLSSILLDETPIFKKAMTFRGDLESTPKPIGVIDSKLSLINIEGISRFEASSGPARFDDNIIAFDWSETFPNMPHIGHPDKFNFKTLTPDWVWI